MDWLSNLLSSELIQAVLIFAVTGFVGWLFTAKGRLFYGVSHRHMYRVPDLQSGGFFPVRTQQIWLQNFGRGTLTDIEVLLNYKPQHYEIWNPRQYEEKVMPDGRVSILIPSMLGRETLTLSIIDTIHDIPVVLDVRSQSGLGRHMNMFPVVRLPSWIYYILWILILAGVSSLIFAALHFTGILEAFQMPSLEKT